MHFDFIFCSSIHISHFYENDKMPSHSSTDPHRDCPTQPLLVNFIIFIGELTSKYEIYIFLYPHASILSRMVSNT
jgi:hypothetical protein